MAHGGTLCCRVAEWWSSGGKRNVNRLLQCESIDRVSCEKARGVLFLSHLRNRWRRKALKEGKMQEAWPRIKRHMFLSRVIRACECQTRARERAIFLRCIRRDWTLNRCFVLVSKNRQARIILRKVKFGREQISFPTEIYHDFKDMHYWIARGIFLCVLPRWQILLFVRKCYYVCPACNNLPNFANNIAFKSLFTWFRKYICAPEYYFVYLIA